MSVLSFGKGIIDRFPAIIAISAFVHNRILGFNKFRIKHGNSIVGLNRSFIKKSKIHIHGFNNIVDLGETCFLEGVSIYINGNGNHIKLNKRIYASGAEFHIEDSNNELMIGDHTSFNGHTHLALTEGKKIHIGKDCMFASDVTVRTGDSHSIIEAESGRRINEAMDITIGEHVWFANHVILLKGASIGPHCIIGSGSVVTAPFDESNAVLAGNPAKVVRRGIDWCRERL